MKVIWIKLCCCVIFAHQKLSYTAMLINGNFNTLNLQSLNCITFYYKFSNSLYKFYSDSFMILKKLCTHRAIFNYPVYVNISNILKIKQTSYVNAYNMLVVLNVALSSKNTQYAEDIMYRS